MKLFFALYTVWSTLLNITITNEITYIPNITITNEITNLGERKDLTERTDDL